MINRVVLGVLLFSPILGWNQSLFEGRIKYLITYEATDEDRKGIEHSLPKECKLYTNGSDWRIEQTSALGDEIITIYRFESDSIYRLMEIGSEKVLIAEKAVDSSSRIWFEKTDDSKSIAGLDCRKTIAQIGDKKNSLWVCEDFANLKHLFWPQSSLLPVSFTMVQSELETVYTAVDHSKEPMDETYFVVSSQYKRISNSKYQRMLR